MRFIASVCVAMFTVVTAILASGAICVSSVRHTINILKKNTEEGGFRGASTLVHQLLLFPCGSPRLSCSGHHACVHSCARIQLPWCASRALATLTSVWPAEWRMLLGHRRILSSPLPSMTRSVFLLVGALPTKVLQGNHLFSALMQGAVVWLMRIICCV